MKRFLLVAVCCATLFSLTHTPVMAQESDLLARINSLRTSLGLSAYSINGALSSAAANQARWMVDNNQVSHVQFDGATPRDRARAAGYPSGLVSENIYMGGMADVNSAWNFWLNSPIHYAGLTNARYDQVGIASASGAGGQSYVLVFGNSSGIWQTTNAVASGTNNAAAPPIAIVGSDNMGNIMYEIQPGDDLGTIMLLFGYTWDKIPDVLTLNVMTQDDIRLLKVGGVLLVPPASGTYTPTPEPTRDPGIPTETATPTITPTPTITATATDLPPALFVLPSITPTQLLIVRTLPPATLIAQVATPTLRTATLNAPASTIPVWLIVAIGVQISVIVVAAVQFFWRKRG